MRFVPLACLFLSACGGQLADNSTSLPISTTPMGPPSQQALDKGLAKALTDTKLMKPVEVSALRQTDHGAGGYFVCLREVNPSPQGPRRIYSVFFDDVYKDVRLSIIMESCETQQYTVLNLPPALTAPASTALKPNGGAGR